MIIIIRFKSWINNDNNNNNSNNNNGIMEVELIIIIIGFENGIKVGNGPWTLF